MKYKTLMGQKQGVSCSLLIADLVHSICLVNVHLTS